MEESYYSCNTGRPKPDLALNIMNTYNQSLNPIQPKNQTERRNFDYQKILLG